MPDPSVAVNELPDGGVRRAGPWTVARRGDAVKAVSSRCRHQLADLSKGTLDSQGCLVCPWHGARYDLDTGGMVEGPKGILWYVGRTPGYTQLMQKVGKALPLRRGAVSREAERFVVRRGPRRRPAA